MYKKSLLIAKDKLCHPLVLKLMEVSAIFFLSKKIQLRFKGATLVHGEYTKEMPKQLETKIK